jgi:hypothetical protein
MQNFEKLTAQILLDRINYLLKEMDIKRKYDCNYDYELNQIAEIYYIAAKLFNIEIGISKILNMSTNYYEIEKELKLIIGE